MIHENVKIFPGAKVNGNLEIKENVSIWYNAVIRGDTEKISIGKNSNVQDNCVLHCTKNYPIKIGEGVSIGHGAVVHGCVIEDNVLIGMNSTILNGAHIGKNSLVAAGAVVTENHSFPDNSLIIGIPAKAIKEVNNEQIELIKNNAKHYVKLSKKYDSNFNYIE